MQVFRTSLFVADVERTLHRRRVRIGNYVLWMPGRKRTSGKRSYGPNVGRLLDVTTECDVLWTSLAEWVNIYNLYILQANPGLCCLLRHTCSKSPQIVPIEQIEIEKESLVEIASIGEGYFSTVRKGNFISKCFFFLLQSVSSYV